MAVNATANPPAPPSTGLGLGDLLNAAFELVRAHPFALAGPLILLGILTGPGQQEPTWEYDLADVRGDPLVLLPFYAALGLLALVVAVVMFFVYAWTWVATSRMALDALDGRPPADPLVGFRETRGLLGGAAWTLLLYLGCVVLGFVALVVPGFIVLGALFPLAAVVAAERITGAAAIKRTWALTRNHRGALLVIVLLGILAAAAVSAILGWIPLLGRVLAGAASGFVYAVTTAAGAVFYARAKRHIHVPAAAAPAVLSS